MNKKKPFLLEYKDQIINFYQEQIEGEYGVDIDTLWQDFADEHKINLPYFLSDRNGQYVAEYYDSRIKSIVIFDTDVNLDPGDAEKFYDMVIYLEKKSDKIKSRIK